MVSRSYRLKRYLQAKLNRLIKWEFWPVWIIYFPVFFYSLWLGVKHKNIMIFTAVNPAIPMGGVMGVRKSKILNILKKAASEAVPAFIFMPKKQTTEQKKAAIFKFFEEQNQTYPIVIKPDNGQRGEQVQIIKSQEQLLKILPFLTYDCLVQRYVSGEEFGVFVIKEPEKKIRITSITHKVSPVLIGDGKTTLEGLILNHPRTNLITPLLYNKHKDDLDIVLKKGERKTMVELGSHCQGAIFKDANHLTSQALIDWFDDILQRCPGLCFGRFDLFVPTGSDLQEGKNISLIEMNGVTSEPAHIYDPQASLITAWKTLCVQWRQAFELGAKNYQQGVKTETVFTLLKTHHRHKKHLHEHRRYKQAG